MLPAMDVCGVKVRICCSPNACEPTIDGQCVNGTIISLVWQVWSRKDIQSSVSKRGS